MRNFDIVSIEPIIDWFNIMTYDLHGTWDGTDKFIGNISLAHTNLTEIVSPISGTIILCISDANLLCSPSATKHGVVVEKSH